MSLFEEVRLSLEKEFTRRKATNKRYSLRAFAKSLDLSISRLSEILNKKRNPSKKQLEKIGKILGGSWTLQLTNINHYDSKTTFDKEQFNLISNWIYLAILCFLKEQKKGFETKALSDNFSYSSLEMEKCLMTLSHMNLIKKIPQKTINNS